MTKTELIEWRRHWITQALFNEVSARIAGLQEELGASAGVNPGDDRYKAGAIRAFKDILETDFIAEELTDD